MGFISDFFKELYQEQCKPSSERVFNKDLYTERDVNELANNDNSEEYTLLYEDAYNNDYDTEEIKRIKQSLLASGCTDLSRAYKIAEEKRKLKEENLKKYYNK